MNRQLLDNATETLKRLVASELELYHCLEAFFNKKTTRRLLINKLENTYNSSMSDYYRCAEAFDKLREYVMLTDCLTGQEQVHLNELIAKFHIIFEEKQKRYLELSEMLTVYRKNSIFDNLLTKPIEKSWIRKDCEYYEFEVYPYLTRTLEFLGNLQESFECHINCVYAAPEIMSK